MKYLLTIPAVLFLSILPANLLAVFVVLFIYALIVDAL
jgi:hypothetical protein